jgi:hypothetical protein
MSDHTTGNGYIKIDLPQKCHLSYLTKWLYFNFSFILLLPKMMGSDGSLSLSEISGLPLPSEPPAKVSNATTEADVDDLIEKWRNLDVGFHFSFVFFLNTECTIVTNILMFASRHSERITISPGENKTRHQCHQGLSGHQ